MSENTDAFNQITDAITQTNVSVIGGAPSIALGSMYLTAAQSNGMMYMNAVNAQHNQFITSLNATTNGISQIYNMNTLSKSIDLAREMNNS